MSSQLFDSDILLNYLQRRSGEAIVLREAISTVLTNVYQCSLYKEESREVRCRVIIIQKSQDEEHLDILRLAQPVPISVTILRRLSLATADPNSAIVIDCTTEKPLLIGCATEGQLLTYFDLLGICKRPYEVVCLGPGVIELSANGSTVRFARDRYVIPELYKVISCAIPSTSQVDLVHRAAFPGILGWINYSQGHSVGLLDPTRFGLHKKTFQAEAPELATYALNGYATRLVAEMRAIGTGSSLLILPFRNPIQAEECVRGYALAQSHERFRGELWNAGVLNMFEWLLHLRMAYLDKFVLCARKESYTTKDWVSNEGKAGLVSAEQIRNSDAKRVARLSAIDGALVVNSILSPVIFGAKFRKVDTSSLPESVQSALLTRGMRHRAMAATVAAIRQSGGIVVSQDGEVTVYSNVDDNLCCHHEEADIDGETSSYICKHAGRGGDPGLPDWLIEMFSDGEASREQ